MNRAEHLIKIQEAARQLPNLLEMGKKEQAVIFLASTIIAAEKLLTDLLDPSAANDTDIGNRCSVTIRRVESPGGSQS